ncbi:hypothetical protein A1Q2_07482 [Trichosporon asahii var. asahii CBS 8904]|uniref:Enoyl reductase (ER) domain-containing protein n=1 Tax=Trichosporon asahii var. asahii (strain CBS 8904) TaxID=1220162 RepID=K1W9D5_TRIAC|nr:hypothetical protein A1Q2_07482 [Trichosporon asahii var. asahii CBS 8904]
MSIPTTRRALVLTPETKSVTLRSLPIPELKPGEVLVKVKAIALNPIDSLYVEHPIAEQERVIGTDFAGDVVAAADDLASNPDSRTKPGTRVSGFLQGGRHDSTDTADPSLLRQLQDGRLHGVSCDPVGPGVGLDRQGLSLPFSPQPTDTAGKTYVIYGASTSLAMYAAQLARALDPAVTLIGVASKGKHDFLRREFGYDYLFDYRDNDWAEQIAALGPVDYAFDAITEGDSTKSLDRILADDGKLVVFRFPKGEFKHEPVYGAAALQIPADPKKREFATKFYEWLSETHALKANPIRRMPGGLEKVTEDGFVLLGPQWVSERANIDRKEDYMKPISGEKLVYTIS